MSATLLVCSNADQLTAARSAGAVAVADRHDGVFAPDDDWVHTSLAVSDRFRVLGPGGDIDLVG